MPIGTIIGFFIGTLLACILVLWIEFDDTVTHQRKSEQLWVIEHRARYAFWLLASLCALIGTFVEKGLV